MSEYAENIIDNILSKNYTNAGDAINQALHAKVADAFETIKIGMGADYSGYEMVDEDYEVPEELDEIFGALRRRLSGNNGNNGNNGNKNTLPPHLQSYHEKARLASRIRTPVSLPGPVNSYHSSQGRTPKRRDNKWHEDQANFHNKVLSGKASHSEMIRHHQDRFNDAYLDDDKKGMKFHHNAIQHFGGKNTLSRPAERVARLLDPGRTGSYSEDYEVPEKLDEIFGALRRRLSGNKNTLPPLSGNKNTLPPHLQSYHEKALDAHELRTPQSPYDRANSYRRKDERRDNTTRNNKWHEDQANFHNKVLSGKASHSEMIQHHQERFNDAHRDDDKKSMKFHHNAIQHFGGKNNLSGAESQF